MDKHPDRISPDEAYELVGDRAPGFKIAFYDEAQINREASRIEGRPITTTKLCVRIKIKGQRDETCRVARREDKARWAKEYEQYTRYKELQTTHTPIGALVPIGVDTVTALRALGCMSVQELADAPEFEDPKDWDLEIARQAAIEITGVLMHAKNLRETGETKHESNDEIIKRTQEAWNREASAEQAERIAQAHHQGHNGAEHAGVGLPGHGQSIGPGGQIDSPADDLRNGQGQGPGYPDYGPRITNFDFQFEGIAADG